MNYLKKMFALLLCMAALLCAGCAAAESAEESGQESPPAQKETSTQEETPAQDEPVQVPDFEMTLLGGDTAAFTDYQGKKVILNFWATWCGPCVGEMPAFQKLAEEYPDELVILAVNCGEDQATVEKFVQDNEYTFPVVVDEDGAVQSVFGEINSIPLTIIIDENGYIVTGHVGASDADSMYELYKEDLGL